MNETSHEPLTVWRFIRRYFVRIVIGTVLVVAVYGALLIWVPYQREQRIAKEIEAYGRSVIWQYFGPDWIPQSMRDRTTLFNRVASVDLTYTEVTDAGLEHLRGLTNLQELFLSDTQVTDAGLEHLTGLTNLTFLNLYHTQITDAGLEHLKGLTKLIFLHLDDTQVTDTGLEHLKGLTNLKFLNIGNTQVTAEGRAMLRKALPKCDMRPDP